MVRPPGGARPALQLPTSDDDTFIGSFLTRSGTFMVEDLLVNKDGLRIVSQGQTEGASVIKASDNQLHLYDIDFVKVIGSGSSGIVQLVRHKWTSQFFALKIELYSQRQIAQELKINQFSQCPNVVVCYESFYDNGAISIVLEYMDGGSLSDFLKRVKSIPEMYLSAICKQVLEGLVYLHHGQHVIHRDLKPSNILINHDGEVKITDFGVSVILADTSGLRDTMIGTRVYMSPERISEQKYGNKSDIWSFGLVMLECATGKFPYSSPDGREAWDGPFELLEAVVDDPSPAAPSDVFSLEFCSFISSCLQKEPKNRPSARELLKHPFLRKYNHMNIDLASYFRSIGAPLATF